MAQPTQQTSNPATRLGLTFGIILGLLSLPTIALVTLSGGYALSGGGLLLIFLTTAFVLCFFGGLLAARRTGRISSGAAAGVIAGAAAAFIAICLGTVIVLLLAPYAELNVLRAARAASGAIGRARRVGPIVAVIRLILGGVILTVAGVIGGTLGGLIGRIGARPPIGLTQPPIAPVGYGAGYAMPTPAGTVGQGSQGYQTPIPARVSPQSGGDQPEYSISYPGQPNPTQPTILEPYRGDDPTTRMPYPHIHTPIPEPQTPTPSSPTTY